MPRGRTNNGVIGPRQTTTASFATGVFDLVDHQVLTGAGLFPRSVPIFRRFTISPAVSGKTSWDLGADGPLELSTAGTWTITPASSYSIDIKMWGAGGSTALYTGGAGGSSVGQLLVTSPTSYIIRVGAVNGGGTAGGVGGRGGGYSGMFNTSETFANSLIIAGGGGQDDGGRGATGGAGGGTTGQSSSGFSGTTATGGTQSAGGTGGGGTAVGSNGSQLTGGNGGAASGFSGGGGGGGYYGGGGGGLQSAWASSGGAGGSGYIGGATAATTYIGSGTTPGNNSDIHRGTAGNVGTAGKVYLY